MNRATLTGNVGKDPEIHTTNAGSKVARFPLATSERWTDKATGEKKEATEWHTIIVWSEPLIEVIEKFVKKGMKLLVEGKIKTRKWQDDKGVDRYSTEIVLQGFDARIELLGSPQPRPGDAPLDTAEPPYGGGGGRGGNGTAEPTGKTVLPDDTIPF